MSGPVDAGCAEASEAEVRVVYQGCEEVAHLKGFIIVMYSILVSGCFWGWFWGLLLYECLYGEGEIDARTL